MSQKPTGKVRKRSEVTDQLPEVEGRASQEGIEMVSSQPFQQGPAQSVVRFHVPDDRFDQK